MVDVSANISGDVGTSLSLADPKVWVGVAAIVILVFALIYVYHHVVYASTVSQNKTNSQGN